VHGGLRGPAGPAHPAQDGGDPRVEMGAGERFDHVVVRAGAQQADDGLLVVAGGGDDNRHVGDAAEHPQRVTAVEIGQPEVENDQVRGLGGNAAQRVQGGADGVHGVPPVGQRPEHRTAHDVIVLDEQHRGHAKTVLPLARKSLNGDAVASSDDRQ
jgi:hypothetical protein